MSAPEGQWGDLATRIVSGVVLAGLGLAAIWAGGYVWVWFVAILSGVIVWELARMLVPARPERAVAMGAVAGLGLVLAIWFPAGLAGPTLLVVLAAGWIAVPGKRRLFLAYLAFILVAAFGLMSLRNEIGVVWMLWLVLVVAVTDIAGYFAGRLMGGPKFWPAISPKKTWSGTVAGWIGAAAVGLAFMQVTGSGAWLLLLSVAASFASQMGDIAESAVKRRSGVKDSSALLPGHGGLFDRFDGMLGASVLVIVVILVTGHPPGPV